MSKRIIICYDGTWNKPSEKIVTNVVKLGRAIELGDKNILTGTAHSYLPGGTIESSRLDIQRHPVAEGNTSNGSSAIPE